MTRRIAVVACFVGLSALSVVPQAAAAAPLRAGSLSVSKAQALPRTTVKLTGKLPPKTGRRVVLQRYRSGLWVSLAGKKSTRLGKFTFTATTPSTTGTVKYRVYAPRKRAGGKMRRAVVTPTRAVRVVASSTTPPPAPPTATPPPPAPGTALTPFPVVTTFTLGDWHLSLGTTDTDAWPDIALANLFNLPPLPGWSYVTVPVAYTNAGQTAKTPSSDVIIDFLGSDHAVYDDLGTQTCGVVANAVGNINDLSPGGSAMGTQCAVVPTSSIEGGLWRIRTGDLATERLVPIR